MRATIRGLMTGPEFHEFLIRGANDRLLTERDFRIIDANHGGYYDFVNETYRRKTQAHYTLGRERDIVDFWDWYEIVQYGFRRAPLALIAHVVENDLPYTEILTADYIMANPMAARAYGAPTHHFDDPDDIHEFKPSSIESYYRQGEGYETEFDRVIGALHILDHGPLSTDYPHAGILNTTSFLYRYPTHGHQPQPSPLALDVLPLSRSRHREVRFTHHGPDGAGGHEQSHPGQSGVHGVSRHHGSGSRSVSELQRRWVL